MAARIAIVDYGMGNLRSVEKALERVGARPQIGSGADLIEAADGVVLPGVGAFPKAMSRIDQLGIAETLRQVAGAGTPLLGICLGMQLLFESSSEGTGARGLGLLPGDVARIEADGLKLPVIGWSPLRIVAASALTEGIDDGEPFYFVHSYAVRPRPEHLLGEIDYGGPVPALVGAGNVWGAQFHPEKSSGAGLRMLANFAAVSAGVPG